MRRLAIVFVVLMLFPPSALAEGAISRRDGFLLIWEGIRRAAAETRETPFADVLEGTNGFAEITYAKARGIVDDDAIFYPDETLTQADALLWLFRTRNVDDLDQMNREQLGSLLARYQLADPTAPLDEPVGTQGQLLALAQALDVRLAEEVHEVSLYSEKFHGKGTAFGETFDMNALTAAHRTFPANTLVKVTNVENGKSVIVRINDRGPYVEGRDMDLSLGAFTLIAPRGQGVARATFQRLGDASLVDTCTGPRVYQKRITRDVRFHRGVPHAWSIGETLTLAANRAFVVRNITYPDGSLERIQDWVLPEELFSFTPSISGTYRFLVGTVQGREREMRMQVWQCAGGGE